MKFIMKMRKSKSFQNFREEKFNNWKTSLTNKTNKNEFLFFIKINNRIIKLKKCYYYNIFYFR